MDTFEKDMAKKQLAIMKNINANMVFLGKVLKRTNDILENQGIAVLPTTSSSDDEAFDIYFSESEIKDWQNKFFAESKLKDDDVKLVYGCINQMMRDITADRERKENDHETEK